MGRRMRAIWFASSRVVLSAEISAGALKRSSGLRVQEFKHARSNENHPRGGRQFRRQAARMYLAAWRIYRTEGRTRRHHYGFRQGSESGQQREERLRCEM